MPTLVNTSCLLSVKQFSQKGKSNAKSYNTSKARCTEFKGWLRSGQESQSIETKTNRPEVSL